MEAGAGSRIRLALGAAWAGPLSLEGLGVVEEAPARLGAGIEGRERQRRV